MNIDALRNFIIIAEEENISTAAKKLHMAQPPLSRQLKNLEEALGVSLFYRNKQRIHLTEEGAYLLDSAKSIIDTIDKTKRQIKEIGSGKKGTIYLGATEAAYVSLLPEAIKAYHQTHPEMVYHMFTANSEEICNSLSSNKLDVGVVLEPYNEELFEGIRLYSGTYLAAFSNQSSLAKETTSFVTVAKLSEQPLIVSTRKASKASLYSTFESVNQEPNIVCEYSLLMTALSMAQIDLGVAIVPSSAVELVNDYPDLSYRTIITPQMDFHLALVRKRMERGEIYNPIVESFWQFMKERFPS